MKTTKLISALLMPAMFVACSDDVFEGMNLENNLQTDLVENLSIAVGMDNGVESRGEFAGDHQYIFKNFYFTPDFTGTGDAFVPTNNIAIKGDQVGLCLPSAAANGSVVTNVPFYVAGYQAVDADGVASVHTLSTNEDYAPFYDFEGVTTVAFETGAVETTTKAKFNAAKGLLTGENYAGPGANNTDIQKAVFKSVSGVMKGNYILYYPYNANFVEQGKVPAVTLKSIQTQSTFATQATATTNHVAGYITEDDVKKPTLFAYSKQPFAVEGGNSAAKNMSMTPAAYFFQFKIYTTAANALNKTIKLITVTTEDDDKAFGINGYVSAGATQNSFAADETTAVDMIGVEVSGQTSIPSATAENYKTTALTAYLSTYPVASKLAGKNIIVRLYDTEGKVATFTKAAGSRIVEGGTDFWTLDLNGKEFVAAERLVYNEASLKAELGINPAATPIPGTLVVKNSFPVASALTIPTGFTFNGADYAITFNNTVSISGSATFNTTVNANGNWTISGADKDHLANVTITTLNNKAELNVEDNSTLTVTTLNNGGATMDNAVLAYNVINVKAKTAATDIDGKLIATTINNVAGTKNSSNTKYITKAGQIDVRGIVENTTIENAGKLSWYSTMGSTVTINNDATMVVAADQTLKGTIVNDGTITVANNVKFENATVTNNGTVTTDDASIVTLIGSTAFENNGTVNDNGTFSGLSRLTNGEAAKFIRKVTALTNLNAALAEEKLTAINIASAITAAEGYEIETEKTIILNANLTLPVAAGEKSTIKNIEFAATAGATLIGNVTAESMTVSQDGTIGAESNVTVNGTITIAEDKTLTGADNSYTICNDIAGKGSVSGTIYVK